MRYPRQAMFVSKKNEVLTNRRPHATEKSTLHAFGYRMIVLCIVSWCMLYLSYRRPLPAIVDDYSLDGKHARAPPAHRSSFNHSTQSLCAEMASELRFAVRCGSRQRPAAKSRNSAATGLCGRCSPRSSRRRTRLCSSEHEETTYIPSIEIPRLNGGDHPENILWRFDCDLAGEPDVVISPPPPPPPPPSATVSRTTTL